MASVQKRGDFQWQAMVRRAGQKPQIKTFETKAQAQAWARKVESDMDSGTFVNVSSMAKVTLDRLLADYVEKETPRKKGAEKDVGLIRHLRSPPIAKRYTVTIQPGDIADYRGHSS